MEKNGELAEKYTKKERLDLLNEMTKLEKFIGGIKEMPKNKKPSLMVVFDANYEKNAVLEAKKTGIPVIGVANTDCLNSHLLTNTVIANTTSIKATCFLISLFADAVASAMGQATKIVGKEDKDIILPYVKKDDSSSANIFGNRK
jgi:small subunit ribosomal protein S2